MTVTSFKSEDTPATLMKITLVMFYKGSFMSLLHNLNPKIYQADLPVLFMVRNFYRSSLHVLLILLKRGQKFHHHFSVKNANCKVLLRLFS